MNWTEVCQNKALQDLPFKIELKPNFPSGAGGRLLRLPVLSNYLF